jgi:hypothetical protein
VRSVLLSVCLLPALVSAATVSLKDGTALTGQIVGRGLDYFSFIQKSGNATASRILPRGDVVGISGETDDEKALLAKPEPDFERSAPQEINVIPAPREKSVEQVQQWYGANIDFRNDEKLSKTVERAEALVIGYLRSTDAARRKTWLDELQGLQLDPKIIRAVVQFGPYALGAALKTGRFYASTVIPGVKDGVSNMTVHVPENYTAQKKWPLIVALHGTMLDGDQYMNWWTKDEIASGFILIAPWANHAHGWGPSDLGRGQVYAALTWAAENYHIDMDRVYIEGASMGGAGTKRLTVLQPDRFAAGCSDSGAPLEPSLRRQYRNLHSLPLYLWSGEHDELVPNAVILEEKSVFETLKLPGTFVIDPNGSHCSNPNLSTAAVEFFNSHTRERYPQRLAFASQEDGPGLRHYYAEIVKADDAANVPYTFNILNIMKMVDASGGSLDKARDVKGFVEKGGDIVVDSRRMWRNPRELELHIDRAQNAVVIDETKLIKTCRIFVDDELLDLDREIKVLSNAKTISTQKVARSIQFMLDEARRTGRRDLTYWGAVTVEVGR